MTIEKDPMQKMLYEHRTAMNMIDLPNFSITLDETFDNVIDATTLDKESFIFENLVDANYDNYMDVAVDILRQLDMLYIKHIGHIPCTDKNSIDGLIYSHWNYIPPTNMVKHNRTSSFQRFDDENMYVPLYYKFYQEQSPEISSIWPRLPFVSAHEVMSKIFASVKNKAIILINETNYRPNDPMQQVALEASLAHEIEHINTEFSNPDKSILIEKPYGMSKFFTPSIDGNNRLGLTDKICRICQAVTYLFSKEEREAKKAELRTALEAFLKNNYIGDYLSVRFRKMIKHDQDTRTYQNLHTTMFKTLLQTKFTYPVHNLRDNYIYIGQLIDFDDAYRHRNDHPYDSNGTMNIIDHLSDVEQCQVYIALGYVFRKYELLTERDITNKSQNDVLMFFDDGTKVRQVLRDTSNYIDDAEIQQACYTVKVCLKRLLFEYVSVIYDVIDAYVDDYLAVLGLPAGDAVRHQYPISVANLQMLDEALKHLNPSQDYVFTDGFLHNLGVHPYHGYPGVSR